MLINRLSLLVLVVGVLTLVSTPVYEQISWRGQVPETYRDAEEVRPGTDVSGTLGASLAERHHVLRARSGRQYTIDVVSDEFDPLVRVYVIADRSATLDGSNDDGGEGNNARYGFCAPSEGGLYVITARAFSGQGAYTLRVREDDGTVCREGEPYRARLPTEFRTTPRVVRPGTPRSATMLGASDHWVLETEASHLYTVDVESSEMDPVVEVHAIQNGSARLEGENDDGGEGNGARYVFCSGGEAGLYVLAVRGFGTATGNYTVRVEDGGIEACQGGGDPRSMLPFANRDIVELRPGMSATGRLPGGERRQYLVVAAPDRLYEVRMESTDFDSYVRLYRAFGAALSELSSNDDGGGGRDAQLTFCATGAGAFVAEAASFAESGSGFYRLRVTEVGGC